jgi:hypothetical protein
MPLPEDALATPESHPTWWVLGEDPGCGKTSMPLPGSSAWVLFQAQKLHQAMEVFLAAKAAWDAAGHPVNCASWGAYCKALGEVQYTAGFVEGATHAFSETLPGMPADGGLCGK